MHCNTILYLLDGFEREKAKQGEKGMKEGKRRDSRKHPTK